MEPESNVAPCIALRDVSVSYGQSRALRGVNLEVAPRQLLAIVGPNGAGKTSLLRAISSHVDYRGSINLLGHEVKELGEEGVVRGGLSHVPQGRLLFPRMTVRENLELGGYLMNKRAVRRSIDELEGRIELLRSRQNQLTRTMSGGEQQIVAVARGLVSSPRVLLLDEPSLGLAPVMITRVMDIVREALSADITVVLAEQNLDLARKYADRIVVLSQGNIVLDTCRDGELDSESLEAAYLGHSTPSADGRSL